MVIRSLRQKEQCGESDLTGAIISHLSVNSVRREPGKQIPQIHSLPFVLLLVIFCPVTLLNLLVFLNSLSGKEIHIKCSIWH